MAMAALLVAISPEVAEWGYKITVAVFYVWLLTQLPRMWRSWWAAYRRARGKDEDPRR